MPEKISDKIKNRPANERAKVKGQEIAKQVRNVPRAKGKRQNYDIEIVETKATDKGVEVYARAWHKNGEQIGFGKDGTVDIERFVIINPPVLVPDPQGDIVRVTEANPDLGIERSERHLREDSQEAMLQVLEHNFSVMKNIHPADKIVRGKRGNTTTTVYPDADPESNTVDGFVRNERNTTWSTIRDAATGSAASDSLANELNVKADNNSGSGYGIERGYALFDTSSIPDDDNIDNATLSGYLLAKQDEDNDSQGYIAAVSTTPASNTSIGTGDYDQVGTTDFGNIDLTSMTTDTYNDFTLNSSGISNISKTGISKFGWREGHDLEDIPVATDTTNKARFNQAEQSGTTQDPKLVVEHSAAETFKPITTMM